MVGGTLRGVVVVLIPTPIGAVETQGFPSVLAAADATASEPFRDM